jgi:signal transduction histidine kinase
MTVRGKVLLFSAVALGLIALQGLALYQGTTRGRIAREWSSRANEQRHLYNQFRGDALLYLEALWRAHGAGQGTAAVLAEEQRRLDAQFAQLRTLTDEEEHWAQASRSEEKEQLARLEQSLRGWTTETEARIRTMPIQAPAEYARQQALLDAYRREVEPVLSAAIEEERVEVEELSQEWERSLRIGQTLALLVPLAGLGLLLALATTILLPMNRRFRELLASAEHIGRGEFGHELSERGSDEFSTLARAFNRMNRELQATQTWLMFSDRLATMGRLSAGVGHEINNPLAYVLSNLNFVQQELRLAQERAPSPERQDLLDALADAREGAERVRYIVQDLKTLSRQEDESTGPVDLAAVVRGAARMASHELRSRARLVEDCAQVPPVLGNATRLGQVFLNLIVNAAHAMPQGREHENEIRVRARLEATGRVTVEVADTGCGIPQENLERIFDPFFTTKPVGEGTGLGLAVCHSIITSHGGTLTVESVVGRGTTFRITLPAARQAGAVAA